MIERTAARGALQFIGDALLGLALFVLMCGLLGGHGPALAEPQVQQLLALEPVRPTVFRQTDLETAKMLLGLVFSVLVALNMAFFRHLRRAYASAFRSK